MLICPQCANRIGRRNIVPLPTGTVQAYGAQSNGSASASTLNPTGFWPRVAAFLLDFLLVGPTAYFAQMTMLPFVGGVLVWWFYFSLFESSRWQATPGKRVLGLKITDVNGVRIDFKRASLRFFGKLLSAAIVGVGFIMAGLTHYKQCLHDMIANTLVLRSR